MWRAKSSISLSRSRESMSDELISDLIDAWCSICLLRTWDESRDWFCDTLWPWRRSVEGTSDRCLRCSLRRLCSRSSRRRWSRLLSRSDLPMVPTELLCSRRRRRRALSESDDGWMPTSCCKLRTRACSSILLSISSILLSSEDFSCTLIFGSTLSPGLYLWRASSFSSSVFALSGFAERNISSRVATVALCRVPRTCARHDGQVKILDPGLGGSGAFSAVVCCQRNQSVRQEPQKVCRQSSSVNGSNRTSVHIFLVFHLG